MKSITIMVPSTYRKAGGEQRNGFNAGKVFDISQTTAISAESKITYDPRRLLEALVRNAPCPIEIRNNPQAEYAARFDPQSRKIYVKQGLDVIRECDVHGISHITGGGFDENIPRILTEGQGVEVKEGSWEILPVFRFLEKWGGVAHREMFNIFNMGVGMVIALDEKEADKAIEILTRNGEKASVIGRIVEGEGVTII